LFTPSIPEFDPLQVHIFILEGLIMNMKIDGNYPYIRLKYSWDMILCLNDFIQCIGLHKDDLKDPRNTGLMEFKKMLGDKDFNPGGVLKDYIYLEANSFFDYAKKLKLDGDKNMPELPSYLTELKEFRNVMAAHRDKNGDINFPQDWIMLQEKTAKLIPIDKLIKDIDAYYNVVIRRHKEALKK
jgi:hypothetical protein